MKLRSLAFFLLPLTLFAKEPTAFKAPLENILHKTGYEGPFEFDTVLEHTQKHWLQYPKQRWDFEKIHEEKKQSLMQDFASLGMIEEKRASKKKYDIAVIHGAALKRVRSRIAFLIEEWNRGVRFDQVALFGSTRPLEPSFEGEKDLLNEHSPLPFKQLPSKMNLPKTEAEMIEFIYRSAKLPFEMEKIPFKVYVSKRGVSKAFETKRPTTSCTTITWLQTNPKEKDLLFVSNQPYILYQYLATKYVLGDEFNIETIGERSSPNVSVASMLDNITKCLFFENLLKD